MEHQTPQEYFETVYRETFEKLSRHIFFKAPGLAEAEDITSKVYTDFYQYVVLKNKRPENVLAYLIKMSNHEVGRLYSHKVDLLSFDDDDLQLSNTIPDNINLETAALDRFENADIWEAVRKLSLAEQQVLIARFRFDMTFQEIARAVGQGDSAVKLRYYRSLAKLQKLLNDVTN